MCLISAPPNHRIRLGFRDEFHIEESENCAYDYLEILDGPFGYSEPIGRYCGTRDPSLIESSGRYLWMRFHSDDSIEYEGFRIVYEFFPSSDERGNHLDGRRRVWRTFVYLLRLRLFNAHACNS